MRGERRQLDVSNVSHLSQVSSGTPFRGERVCYAIEQGH